MAISIWVTLMSAVSVLGTPLEVYLNGIAFIIFGLSFTVSVPIVAHVFVPFFYRLKLTSVYEVRLLFLSCSSSSLSSSSPEESSSSASSSPSSSSSLSSSAAAAAAAAAAHHVVSVIARVSGRVVVVVVRELFSLVTSAICVRIRGQTKIVYHMTQVFCLLLRSHHSEFVGTI